jgi:hypothetical protein
MNALRAIFPREIMLLWLERITTSHQLIIDLGKTKYTAFFLRGNHDELVIDYWKATNFDEKMWYKTRCGEATGFAYEKIAEATKKLHIDFLIGLDNYFR